MPLPSIPKSTGRRSLEGCTGATTQMTLWPRAWTGPCEPTPWANLANKPWGTLGAPGRAACRPAWLSSERRRNMALAQQSMPMWHGTYTAQEHLG